MNPKKCWISVLFSTSICSSLFFICHAVCGDLPSFLNADAPQEDLRKTFPVGTTISFSCHIEQNINSSAICINENGTSYWKYEPFSCELVCTDYPNISNAELQPDQELPILNGDSVKYVCDTGFTTDEIAPKIKCENGSWTLPKEACRPKNCGYPGDIENSYREGQLYNFPHSVTYKCKEGFRLKGTATIFCAPTGHWRPSKLPSCEAVVCPLLSQLENGKVVSSDRKYNAVATYECNRNFHLEGNAVRVCQDDATWNGSVPTCIATTCLNPGPLANGRVIPQKDVYNAGDVVIFQCFQKRPDEGQHASKCLEDGTWQKRPPHCAVVPTSVMATTESTIAITPLNKTTEHPFTIKSSSCDDPGDIRNGHMKITGFTPNSSVTYSCEDGYELRGEGTLHCLPSGKWNLDKLPICVKPIPTSTILGIVIGLILLVILVISGFYFYQWRERKLRGYGKKSKALTADATDLEEIAGLEKGKKPIPVTVL